MKTLKGPGIFLAQYAGDAEPFNSLPAIARWAASLGFVGVQIPSNDKRLFDLEQAASSKTYCDDVAGMRTSSTLQGRLDGRGTGGSARTRKSVPGVGASAAAHAFQVRQASRADTATRPVIPGNMTTSRWLPPAPAMVRNALREKRDRRRSQGSRCIHARVVSHAKVGVAFAQLRLRDHRHTPVASVIDRLAKMTAVSFGRPDASKRLHTAVT